MTSRTTSSTTSTVEIASGIMPRCYRRTCPSVEHGTRGEVRADLALDPLQGVVDGLGVAAEAHRDLLVRTAVEVEREDARLELRQRRRQAADERVQLLRRDDLVDGVVHRRPGD